MCIQAANFPACMHPIRMRAFDFCSLCGERWHSVTADIRPNGCFWKFSTNHQYPSKSVISRARVWWRRCGGKCLTTPSSNGPASYQQISALLGIRPLSDSNIVYAIHFYEPMVFTHQGLTWSNDPLRYLHGVPFPTDLSDPRMLDLTSRLVQAGQSDAVSLLRSQLNSPWDERRVISAIARAADWANRNGRPVVLNEFGVLSWKAPAQDRARWINVVRRAAESHCIGWTHWEYADGFGFVRRSEKGERPDHAILEALLGSLNFKRQRPH